MSLGRRGGYDDLTPDERVKAIEAERLVIPADYRSSFADYRDWLQYDSDVLYLGKGPSLLQAEQFFATSGVIATVNEACLVAPRVDFAFFTDYDALERSRSVWDRIGTFVTTAMLHAPQLGCDPIPVDRVLQNKDHRVIVVHESQMNFVDWQIKNRVTNERLVTTDTAVMGLHFLHIAGYRRFRLLGHDGGIGYATGMPNVHPNRDMSRFRQAIEFVGRECSSRYSSRIEFYDGLVIDLH